MGTAAQHEFKHLFGPVPSRRLGRSLGVDIVPLKTCAFDCVYCQLGRTTNETVERAEYVPVEDILREFRTWFGQQEAADYITLSGSGEPTLHSRFGDIIRGIRAITHIPVALLTNGALLWDTRVREDACLADLLIPSLDAATADVFHRVNRPHPSLERATIVEGLVSARRQCAGEMWLEVMLVAGVNDTAEELAALRAAIDRIQPERIQINTPVRPAGRGVQAPSAEALLRAREALGPTAEIITRAECLAQDSYTTRSLGEVLSLLRRRPCTVADIARGLGMHPNEVAKYVLMLLNSKQAVYAEHDGAVYYHTSAEP
jgi:wyosine [tRNA(Phe)-imidazoG37] synthetase (radical SAM superfamily)